MKIESLSDVQLKKLKEHKYSCENVSILDPYMQVFWNAAIQKFPLWLAPNTMTIIGLGVNIVTSLLVFGYNPDGKSDCPAWVYVFCAAGLFIYQTLDALDGKQARRTGSSSPLGELFDHGCDSISTVFVTIAVSITMQLGRRPEVLFAMIMWSLFLFYLAHWTTYVCGTLRFGYVDITEGQFMAIGSFLATGVFGATLWEVRIPLIYLPLWILPVLFSTIAGGIAALACFNIIFTGGVGKNKSTVADTSVLFPAVPILSAIIPAYIIYWKSPSQLYENHPCVYLLAFGFVAAKITCRLVVAHMTKSEMDALDTVLWGPALLFLNQYFNCPISEHWVLYLCLIYSIVNLTIYSVYVCQQICDSLNIFCFTIKNNKFHSSSSNG